MVEEELDRPLTLHHNLVTPRVFFSLVPVKEEDATKLVPQYCKIVPLPEILLDWKENEHFRWGLSIDHAAWTSQVGLDLSGPCRIDDKGNLTEITEDEYNKLSHTDKCICNKGEGRVAVIARYDRLIIEANADPWDVAKMAIMPDEEKLKELKRK